MSLNLIVQHKVTYIVTDREGSSAILKNINENIRNKPETTTNGWQVDEPQQLFSDPVKLIVFLKSNGCYSCQQKDSRCPPGHPWTLSAISQTPWEMKCGLTKCPWTSTRVSG